MADIKKRLKDAGDIANTIAVVGSALTILQPAVSAVAKTVKEKADERKEFVDIPELYSKGLPIKLDRAKLLLEDCGLKVEPVEVRDVNVQYKDCFDLQVVGSKPKHKQKVKPGTLVYLKYVTSNIIEESRKLFDESEKRKTEVKLEKINKQLEQKEKTKKMVNDVMTSIQQSAIDITGKTKDRLKRGQVNSASEEDRENTSDS